MLGGTRKSTAQPPRTLPHPPPSHGASAASLRPIFLDAVRALRAGCQPVSVLTGDTAPRGWSPTHAQNFPSSCEQSKATHPGDLSGLKGSNWPGRTGSEQAGWATLSTLGAQPGEHCPHVPGGSSWDSETHHCDPHEGSCKVHAKTESQRKFLQ